MIVHFIDPGVLCLHFVSLNELHLAVMRAFHLAKSKVSDFRVDLLNRDQSSTNPNDPRLVVIYHTLLPEGYP